MTDVTADAANESAGLSAADEQLLAELAERAKAGGLKLTGGGGLLGKLTKMVVEGALEGELDDHLGYSKHDPAGRDGGNSRNGHRTKTVITEAGPVEISVPRDRDSSFEPKIVAKRQRRLTGVEDMVISLSAKGLTHGEISAHLQEIYGAEVSKQTITAITDRVMDGMAEWQSRPLDPVYAVVFVDAIHVKIREGQVANRPVYLALGVTVDGERDILGLWAGEHGDGEGAKFWLRVLPEIKNRGTRDVLMLVCDGLKGLPDAVNAVWEKTVVQACIVHLLRNSFKYASKRDRPQIARDIKPVYTAVSEAAALDALAEFSAKWEKRYPAITRGLLQVSGGLGDGGFFRLRFRLGGGFFQAGPVAGHRLRHVLRQVAIEMPAVRDLLCFRGALAGTVGVGAGPVAADHLGPGVLLQPLGEGGRFAVAEQVNGLTGLGVDQDGPVVPAAAEREVIDLSGVLSHPSVTSDSVA
jgi:putative transposase